MSSRDLSVSGAVAARLWADCHKAEEEIVRCRGRAAAEKGLDGPWHQRKEALDGARTGPSRQRERWTRR